MLSSYQAIDQYLQGNKASSIIEIEGMLNVILSSPNLIAPRRSRGYLRGIEIWEIDLDPSVVIVDYDKEKDINNIILTFVNLAITDNELKTNDSNQNFLKFKCCLN